MNNKQNNINRGLLDTQRGNVGNQYQNFVNGAQGDLNKARDGDNNLRNEIFNKYSDPNAMLSAGGRPNASGWFNLPEEGPLSGAAGGDYSAAKAGYGKFAETGGVNRADFNPALDSYKNFINNGGIGGTDEQLMMRGATSTIPAMFQGYKNSLSRRSNVQGGYSPGFDSQMQEIGREAGRSASDATASAASDIVGKRQQGKMFGTSGFGGLMSDITGKEQYGKLAGLGGLKGIGDSEQSNNQFNAGLGESRNARNQSAQLGLADMYNRNQQFGASGLESLYRSAPGASGQANSNLLAGLGGMSQNDLSNLALRLGIKDKDFMDLIGPLLGVGSSLVTGMGGTGASSGGRGYGPAGRPPVGGGGGYG